MAPPDPSLDCDILIEPADVAAACGQLVEPSKDQPTDDIGADRTCSRRWDSKEAGALSLLVVRHGSDAEAKERYKDIEGSNVSEVKSISGIGDFARTYVKKGLAGHPIYQVEAVKGRFNVVVFNPKVTIGQTTVGPVCDEKGLQELMTRLMKRIP